MFLSSGEHLRNHLLDLPCEQGFSQSLFPIKLFTLVSNFQLFPTIQMKLAVFLLIRCAEMKIRNKISEHVLAVLM